MSVATLRRRRATSRPRHSGATDGRLREGIACTSTTGEAVAFAFGGAPGVAPVDWALGVGATKVGSALGTAARFLGGISLPPANCEFVASTESSGARGRRVAPNPPPYATPHVALPRTRASKWEGAPSAPQLLPSAHASSACSSSSASAGTAAAEAGRQPSLGGRLRVKAHVAALDDDAAHPQQLAYKELLHLRLRSCGLDLHVHASEMNFVRLEGVRERAQVQPRVAGDLLEVDRDDGLGDVVMLRLGRRTLVGLWRWGHHRGGAPPHSWGTLAGH